jgi:RNA polymerase sigma factor (TIGR02999 family)
VHHLPFLLALAEPVSSGVMSDVTRILDAIQAGEPQAAGELLPLVYGELRKLAAAKLAHEKPGQTLEPTALVHEAYLRLVSEPAGENWEGRGHFFAAAAEAMRRILIENARRKKAARHGGDLRRVELCEWDLATDSAPEELLLLDEALARLAQEDAAAAMLVKLRYFSGLSVEEAAEMAGFSRATAFRHWSFARAWLISQMSNSRAVSAAGPDDAGPACPPNSGGDPKN